MQKELKFYSKLTCKRKDSDLTFKSNEVKVIVLQKPKIVEHKIESCENVCEKRCKKSCECENLIYFFLFSKLI